MKAKIRFQKLARYSVVLAIALICLGNLVAQEQNLFFKTGEVAADLSAEQANRLAKVLNQGYTSVDVIQFSSLQDANIEGKIQVDVPTEPCGKIEFSANTVEYRGEDDYYWYGDLVPKDDCNCTIGYLMLTKGQEGVSGSIVIEERTYIIEDLGEGRQIIGKVSEGHNANCSEVVENLESPSEMEVGQNEISERGSSNCDIRVLVLMTPAAMASLGNPIGLVTSAIDKTNQAFQNSLIWPYQTKLVLAGFESTAGYFTENSITMANALDDIWTNPSAIARRNANGADLVVLYVNEGVMTSSPAAGVAFLGGRWAVVRANGSDNGFVFAHEVGHLLRAHHEHCTTLAPGPGCLNNSGIAHAHTFRSGKCEDKDRKTIVYSRVSPDQILHYSNPYVNYDRAATGQTGLAYNADIIRNQACITARYSTLFDDIFRVRIVGPQTGCRHEPVMLQAQVEGTGNGALSYAWQVSSDGINYGPVTGTDDFFDLWLPPIIGTKRWVKLSVTNSLGQTKTAFWQVTVVDFDLCDRSITTEAENFLFSYPNPVSDNFVIQIEGAEKTGAQFRLYDSFGKTLKSKDVGNVSIFTIDLKDLVPGVYYYSVLKGDKVQSGKLIKQ